MDKKLKWFAIVFGGIFLIAMLGKITGLLRYYSIPTVSNEPGVKFGSKIFTSNLKNPGRGDIVIFTSKKADSIIAPYGSVEKTGTNYLFRLCGQENDVIEMKNAVLFVNGINFDADLDLYHFYKIPNGERTVYDEVVEIKGQGNIVEMPGDSFALYNLTKGMIGVLNISAPPEIYLLPFEESENSAFQWYGRNEKEWSADNFGPLKIPPRKLFLLGDNRHNALDSRYIGFVDASNIVGVKL